MNKVLIGKKEFGSTMDVTDPCYNRDVWCRINELPFKEGTYRCSVYVASNEETDGWGERVASIWIEPDMPVELKKSAYKQIGSIGVDSGMAGFFTNKPDFNDQQWQELVDLICQNESKGERAFVTEDGFFSSSGYGDGSYPVYAVKNKDGVIVAMYIKFLG